MQKEKTSIEYEPPKVISAEAAHALAAMRRGIEKATRQRVVLVRELREASSRLRDAGFEFDDQTERGEPWRTMFAKDPAFALAFVRVEIEIGLQKIANRQLLPQTPAGALDHLWNELLLAPPQAKPMADLLRLLNSTLHGAIVDPKASVWALQEGLAIIQAILHRTS